MKQKTAQGFTLIELLIVIAVLGILAVAVLSAINPIEQINRSSDTGSRSDAEQLISAIDRFYASQQYYPWKSGPAGSDALEWTQVTSEWVDNGTNPVPVLDKLSGSNVEFTGSGELKLSFVERITDNTYNPLYVYNRGDAGDSTYVCFDSKSNSFQKEAKDLCDGTKGSIPLDLEAISFTNICDVTVNNVAGRYLTCLP
jgi:prepilin-type N-terminal cleavage/methylation domain-containing protein